MANQTRQLARLLQESGISVDVVRTNAPYRLAWIDGLRGVRAVFRLTPFLVRLWRVAGRVDVFHVMANSGWAWHLLAAPAVWIARWRGKAVVVNYRGGEAEAFLARESRWVVPTLVRASLVIVPSNFLAGVFRRHGVEAEIVQNIIDLSCFRPAERSTADPHLIMTRNLEDIYDIPTAVRAFASVKRVHEKARLTIAGSGPARPELERLTRELGLERDVTFAGRIDNEQIAELYRSASLFLNSSRVDNMPISLLEAMASGLPIVSTDVGGIPFLVEDGTTALLVRPGDPSAMADAVLRLLADRALGDRLVAAGLAAAQAYTWERVRPRLLDAYARALARGASSAGSGTRDASGSSKRMTHR
jgi:glycosyltransferase involved in cell wall biosynthesis